MDDKSDMMMMSRNVWTGMKVKETESREARNESAIKNTNVAFLAIT